MKVSFSDYGLGPNQNSRAARQTLEEALRRKGSHTRMYIGRSDEDDPAKAAYLEELARKRASKQQTQ